MYKLYFLKKYVMIDVVFNEFRRDEYKAVLMPITMNQDTDEFAVKELVPVGFESSKRRFRCFVDLKKRKLGMLKETPNCRVFIRGFDEEDEVLRKLKIQDDDIEFNHEPDLSPDARFKVDNLALGCNIDGQFYITEM